LVRGEFGLHRNVTSLPAEGDRLCVFERPISAECAHEKECKGKKNKGDKRPSTARIVEIDDRVCRELARLQPAAATPLDQSANDGDKQAKAKNAGNEDINNEIGVRIVVSAERRQQNEQKDTGKTRSRYQNSDIADRI